MKTKLKPFRLPAALFVLFILHTAAVLLVDLEPVGPLDSTVGLASLNASFAQVIGTKTRWYVFTEYLGLAAMAPAGFFGLLGFVQLIKRRSPLRIDRDILWLGTSYLITAGFYVLFELFPVNFRPVLMEGVLEASYPSSHTLLALCIVSTAIITIRRRMQPGKVRILLNTALFAVMLLTVIGRLLSGVHWLTDITGAVLLSGSIISFYHEITDRR